MTEQGEVMTVLSFIILLFSFNVMAIDGQSIHEYERHPMVEETLKKMKSSAFKSSKGMCAKHVRQGYMESGLITSHPGINYAKNYHEYFTKESWTNLFSRETNKNWNSKLKVDLLDTPSGCAMVYDSINPRNDRNGEIGHIEIRIKPTTTSKNDGVISDYFSTAPRTGYNCIQEGKVSKRLRVFKARKSSTLYKSGALVKKYVNVTECEKYSKTASHISDEWTNRKLKGVFCKLQIL